MRRRLRSGSTPPDKINMLTNPRRFHRGTFLGHTWRIFRRTRLLGKVCIWWNPRFRPGFQSCSFCKRAAQMHRKRFEPCKLCSQSGPPYLDIYLVCRGCTWPTRSMPDFSQLGNPRMFWCHRPRHGTSQQDTPCKCPKCFQHTGPAHILHIVSRPP